MIITGGLSQWIWINVNMGAKHAIELLMNGLEQVDKVKVKLLYLQPPERLRDFIAKTLQVNFKCKKDLRLYLRLRRYRHAWRSMRSTVRAIWRPTMDWRASSRSTAVIFLNTVVWRRLKVEPISVNDRSVCFLAR